MQAVEGWPNKLEILRKAAPRVVTSSDGMTADDYPFKHSFLARVSTRIVNEVSGVNRVVYDITSKPPGTIEWSEGLAADLILGLFDSDTWSQVAEICERHRLDLPSVYSRKADEGWFISLLNDASFDFFNTYAAGLEGFHGSEAMMKTKFRNLPWWLESFWLPLKIETPIVDGTTFVGSSVLLLNELAEIRRMSKIDVAGIPPGYAEMRKNYKNWFRRSEDDPHPLSEDDTLRWVWNALHDSAQISIERQIPIMLAP